MSEKPAAGPWVKIEDAPWAKDGHSILGDWGGEPKIASWDDKTEVWYTDSFCDYTATNPDRVARINMEGAGG